MRLVHNSLHDEVAARLRERIFAGESRIEPQQTMLPLDAS